jgi:hypothetical protein
MILCPLHNDRNRWNRPARTDMVTTYEHFPLLFYTGG